MVSARWLLALAQVKIGAAYPVEGGLLPRGSDESVEVVVGW
ncbi:hypothetical protein [Thermostichus sp. OS-CIW-23]